MTTEDQPDLSSPQTSGDDRGSRRHKRLLNLPNQLTIARIILSIIFFVVLALQTHGTFDDSKSLVLNVCVGLFVLAVVTDFLDGYLARKWQMISTFGRIADPFADKIVICGSFVMLTGVSPDLVEPWFAVVVMFREFLVSGLRSFLESRGVAFGAALSGKLKMVLQSVTIPVVLFYEANMSATGGEGFFRTLSGPFRWLAIGLLAGTLIITIASCIGYLRRAAALLRDKS